MMVYFLKLIWENEMPQKINTNRRVVLAERPNGLPN
jgi:hypothetical protein